MRLAAIATVNGQEVGRLVCNDRDLQQVAQTLAYQAAALYRGADGRLAGLERLVVELVPEDSES